MKNNGTLRYIILILNPSANFEKYEHKPRLKPGTLVRCRVKEKPFSKNFRPTFSEEIYKIERFIDSAPPMYRLQHVRRPYYADELIVVAPGGDREKDPREFIIESKRILQGRQTRSGPKANDETQYLVRSIYKRDKASWISAEKLKEPNCAHNFHALGVSEPFKFLFYIMNNSQNMHDHDFNSDIQIST